MGLRISAPRVEGRDCHRLELDGYTLEEVVLPGRGAEKPARALRLSASGQNLSPGAMVLLAFVGKQQVRYLRSSPDGRALEGVLLQEPAAGDHVDVVLGEERVRHPAPVDPASIRRLPKARA